MKFRTALATLAQIQLGVLLHAESSSPIFTAL